MRCTAIRSPYAGFILDSTAGISSAAQSNTFSVNQSLELDFIPAVETKLDFQGEVKLPGTKYDATTNTVGLMVRLARCGAVRRAAILTLHGSALRRTGAGRHQVSQSNCDADAVERTRTCGTVGAGSHCYTHSQQCARMQRASVVSWRPLVALVGQELA